MEFCRRCHKPLETELERRWSVVCSGQCGATYHVRCSRLTPSEFSALSEEEGLLWFCSDCLPGFNPAVTAIRKSTMIRVEELETKLDRGLDRVEGLFMGLSVTGAALVEQFRDEPVFPALPTEIWELIFQNLNLTTLKKVRLTCRGWNEIVTCCPSISNSYVLEISMPPKAEDIKYIRKLLSNPDRYTNVQVALKPFANPFQGIWWKSAWQSFGQNVQIFKCKASNQTNPTLMEMLRHMPNLRDFTYNQTDDWRERIAELVNEDVVVPSRLDHVHSLMVKKIEFNVGMITIFARIFTKLKVIKFKTRCGPFYMMEGGYENKCIDFLRANESTLEVLKLYPTNCILDALTNFDKLQLKRLSLDYNENFSIDKIVQLTKRQSKIEHLRIIVKIKNIAVLYEIARNLPNLKSFKFYLPESEAAINAIPAFLSTLTNLETLGLRRSSRSNEEDSFNLGDAVLPNLRKFKAILVNFAKGSLPNFAARCPKLGTIDLRNSCLDWADFPALVTRAPSLDKLKLLYLEKHSPVGDLLADVPTQSSNLRYLWLTGCEAPEELVRYIGYICPKLELLHMSRFPAYREWLQDRTMEELCPALDRLRELKLYGFEYVSESSLMYLVKYCPNLNKVLLGGCQKLNEESSREVLRSLKGVEVIFGCGMVKTKRKH